MIKSKTTGYLSGCRFHGVLVLLRSYIWRLTKGISAGAQWQYEERNKLWPVAEVLPALMSGRTLSHWTGTELEHDPYSQPRTGSREFRVQLSHVTIIIELYGPVPPSNHRDRSIFLHLWMD